jgi:hypothetical protein
MGCDIHAYIEYKAKGKGNGNWRSFGGRINPGRNYAIFGRLAQGVRTDGPAVVPLRGFPEDAGFYAKDDALLFVTADGKGDNYCTIEDAQRWNPGKYIKIHDHVPHPDWHSHSWVSADELDRALGAAYADYPGNFPEPEYQAVLVCMRSFEQQGFDSRLVFWFDN